MTAVKTWKTSIAKSNFIHEVVKEKYNTRLKSFLILAFIINTVLTTLNAVVSAILGLDPSKTTLCFWFNIVITGCQAINTCITGSITILGWTEIVNVLSTFIQKS